MKTFTKILVGIVVLAAIFIAFQAVLDYDKRHTLCPNAKYEQTFYGYRCLDSKGNEVNGDVS